jgi:hypothetical protein
MADASATTAAGVLSKVVAEKHPTTFEAFQSTVVPDIETLKEFSSQCPLSLPQPRIGWDAQSVDSVSHPLLASVVTAEVMLLP